MLTFPLIIKYFKKIRKSTTAFFNKVQRTQGT